MLTDVDPKSHKGSIVNARGEWSWVIDNQVVAGVCCSDVKCTCERHQVQYISYACTAFAKVPGIQSHHLWKGQREQFRRLYGAGLGYAEHHCWSQADVKPEANLSNLIRNDLALSTPLGLSPSSVFRAPHAPATKARRVSCFIDLGPINLGFISGICYSEAKMLFPIHGFACQRIDFASLFWWPMIYYFEDQYHSNILSTFPKIAKVVPDHCSQLFLKICAGTVNFG